MKHYLSCHMNYTITEHYARGEEKPIAAFNELNNSRLFITKKSSIDEDESKKVIYRLYDDHELVQQINIENISTSHARYAEGNGDFNSFDQFIYVVMIQTMDSQERKMLAQFNNKDDALLFIVSKFENNNTVHDNDLFLIFKDKNLLDTVNKTIIEHRNRESNRSSSNDDASKYTLSPLSTRPTPGGGPADYWVEKKDADDK